MGRGVVISVVCGLFGFVVQIDLCVVFFEGGCVDGCYGMLGAWCPSRAWSHGVR